MLSGPEKLFITCLTLQNSPAETSPETACCLFLSRGTTSAAPAAGGNSAMYLSRRRQVHYQMESGVSCQAERRLLNKGVSGNGGKRSHLSISQMEKRWRGLIFLPSTFLTDIHVSLRLTYYCLFFIISPT